MVNQHPEPETAVFLAELAVGDPSAFDELTIDERRAGLEAMFLAAAPVAPKIQQGTITIPARDGRQITGLTFYPGGAEHSSSAEHPRSAEPSGGTAVLPVLFLIQGGGWALSGAAPYAPLAALLATELQRLVVVVDFRLAPEHKFPCGLEDCMDAYGWLQENAGLIGGDSGNIAVFGDSAGGNLAGALSLSCEEQGLKKPTALVLVYPMIDVQPGSANVYPSRQEYGGGGYLLTEASIMSSAADYVRSLDLLAHPMVSLVQQADLTHFPRTIIITAGMDPLRDEGKVFADRLRNAGVDVTYKVYDGTIHGFLSLFHRLSVAYEAVSFLQKALSKA